MPPNTPPILPAIWWCPSPSPWSTSGVWTLPNFEAPSLTGFNSVQLRFELVVADKAGQSSKPAFVTIAVAADFYSGVITGPSFCANNSLGGATTHAFDSDSGKQALHPWGGCCGQRCHQKFWPTPAEQAAERPAARSASPSLSP